MGDQPAPCLLDPRPVLEFDTCGDCILPFQLKVEQNRCVLSHTLVIDLSFERGILGVLA